ncbi:MAG TPA: DUF4038 domain-containing protein [Streptosporangiaceae bacterium]|nr:DUF4038 domain-containing protein [Streptosporangiaceae bacterium]
MQLSVGPDRRHVIDETGNPVLIQGDAAWSLIVNTTVDEATWYLDQRRAQGFNVLLINLIEYLFATDAPRTLMGDEPFTTPGDFTTPNESYFAHAEQILDLARARGFIVILYPSFLGYPNPHYPGYEGQAEGWYDEVVANGPDGCRAYGEYLGRRFGSYENIVWSIGCDRNPEDARAGLEAMAEGIKKEAPGLLMTAQMLPEHTAAEWYPDAEWLDLLSTYSYQIIPRLLERDWRTTPTRPFFLVESAYENEHHASQLQLRRAAYWSVLGGGIGHVMGNKPIWMFGPQWKDHVASDGAYGLARFGEFFRSVDWSSLVPDYDEKLVSSGHGETRGLNQLGAARSEDGRLAIVYIPERRSMTIETDVLAGAAVVATWFDPVSGQRLPGGTLAVNGPVVLTPPYPDDAVLLLEATAAR